MKIIIDNLSKSYGPKKALDTVSLEIHDGMYGLLGPNGAGKTTLMRILATLLQKSGGSVSIDGIDIGKRREIRKRVGYLPQDFSLYPSLSVYEAMDYLALLSEIKDSKRRKTTILDLLERVNLQHNLKTKVKALSGGMKRRLGIAQALLNDPKLVIVDEPTAGLDPEERIRFRNLLSDFSSGRTVLLSTHIVSDIEHTCENLAILKEGVLHYKGRVQELLQQAKDHVWTVCLPKSAWEREKGALELQGIRVVSSVPENDQVRLRLVSPTRPFDNAETAAPTIEDAYMKLVKEV